MRKGLLVYQHERGIEGGCASLLLCVLHKPESKAMLKVAVQQGNRVFDYMDVVTLTPTKVVGNG